MGSLLDASAEDGSVDVVLPSDRAPKLWAVGGAIQADGSAVVSVILQGRGVVCGGSFTLTYAQSLSAQAEPESNCQINAEPGRIRASFASATPVADQITLLKITIQNAVPGKIDLLDAVFLDDDGSRIAVADVRPTTLSRTSSAAAFARNAAGRYGRRTDTISAGCGRERHARWNPGSKNGFHLPVGSV